MNKYHNVKTRGYDSAHEAERARVLHLLEKAGKIRDLREQVRYVLIPAIWATPEGKLVPIWGENGQGRRSVFETPEDDEARARKGWRCLQRRCEYVADFVYGKTADGKTVVEDVKGFPTPEYRIKKKLMLWVYGIEIKEVG